MYRRHLHAEAARPERMRWHSRRAAPVFGTGLAVLALTATGWPADLAFADRYLSHWYPNSRRRLIEFIQTQDLSAKELEFLKGVLKEHFDQDIVNRGKKKLWEDALSMYESMEDLCGRDETTDFAFMGALSMAAQSTRRVPNDQTRGIWKQALQLMADVTARDQQTVDMYAACIQTLLESSKGMKEPLEKTFDVFNDMKKRGLQPTDSIYTNQLQACEYLGDWQHAITLLHDCKEMNLIPEQSAYNRVINLLEDAEEDELYIEVLEDMGNLGYDLEL